MTYSLFDTHCHLADPALAEDLNQVVSRAREAGVSDMLVIGLDVENSLQAQAVATQYGFYFAAGIHPSDCGTASNGDYRAIIELSRAPRCRAIGEIGLDFYHESNPPAAKQVEVFREMLAIASEVQLPIVIHQRKSAQEVLEVIDEFTLPAGGVFHCFSGDWEYAQEVMRRGFQISLAGNITYKNTPLLETAIKTPLDRLLIETDAPYLAPVPHRGKRNEPAFVSIVANWVAELRGVTVEELSRQLYENSVRLFGSKV